MRPFLIVLFLAAIADSAAQDGTFRILKGEKVVGSILVRHLEERGRTEYTMSSRSSVVVLWTHDIRSEMRTVHEDGRITGCHSSYRVDDELRDSSHMRLVGGKPLCYIHPGRVFLGRVDNPWSVARMYYEEPVGQDSIFVESALRNCHLAHSGNGRYVLTMPDQGTNHYTYRDGVLQEILIDRTWFDLVFRRT